MTAKPAYCSKFIWNKGMGNYVCFTPNIQPPAKHKINVNKIYKVIFTDNSSITGVFEGYYFTQAFSGAPVLAYYMFFAEEKRVLLPQNIIARIEDNAN